MELGGLIDCLRPEPKYKYFATLKKRKIHARIEANDREEVANWISDLFIENRMGDCDRDQTETTICKWVSRSGVEITCNFELEQ